MSRTRGPAPLGDGAGLIPRGIIITLVGITGGGEKCGNFPDKIIWGIGTQETSERAGLLGLLPGAIENPGLPFLVQARARGEDCVDQLIIAKKCAPLV